ncbi:hypothetical protein PHAVU_003G143266 [Phaseolus vulgaris]
MCTRKARVRESSNSISGLTQLQIFTPIPFSGILHMLYSMLMVDQLGSSRTRRVRVLNTQISNL